MKKLYKFYVDCGRMGDLNGLFIEEEAKVKTAIGKNLYFGDVLGKHSEISGPLEENEVTILTDDQDFIAKFKQIVGDSIGHNPLDHIQEEEIEE